ncbi:MAG: DUF4040 domain-containing protein [bacterium]|nr:DUF4040 domain-containing protein [bacterium]
MLLLIMFIFLFILIFLSALFAVLAKDLLFCVISLGVMSLATSIVFFILNAPDVAITEASVGAALTTAIYVFGVRRTEREEK